MKKNLIKYLFYGLLGGVLLYLLRMTTLYTNVNTWFFVLLLSTIVFLPMFINRLRRKDNNSFSTLFGIGITVASISIFGYNIISQFYPKVAYSEEQKIKLVDEKVNRLIMEFKGGNIDIFELEERALSFFDRSWKQTILSSLALVLLSFLLVIFLSLILKSSMPGPP